MYMVVTKNFPPLFLTNICFKLIYFFKKKENIFVYTPHTNTYSTEYEEIYLIFHVCCFFSSQFNFKLSKKFL